jgi:hypothetical protein
MPLPTILKDELLKVFSRFIPRGSWCNKTGNIFSPNGQYIQNHMFLSKGKGGISGIEGFKQTFGKGKNPLYLPSAFIGAVTPARLYLFGSAGNAPPHL